MAVTAGIRPLELREFFLNRHGLWIGRLFVVLMTGRAGGDGHIRRQPAQRRGAGDVDMTAGALQHVLTLTAFVIEFCRDTLRRRRGHEGVRRFVTANAVSAHRCLIFPVTGKARVVAVRHRFEELVRGS